MKSILVYIIALFFAYSFSIKILDFNNFEIKLIQSELINNDWTTVIGYSVLLIEFSIVILLFFNIKRKETLLGSFLFLILLTAYLLALNEFSLFNGCSCGGVFDKLTYSEHLFVNFLFIAINFIALLLFRVKANKLVK